MGFDYSKMADLGFHMDCNFVLDTFWNFQNADQILTLGPLCYYRNTLKYIRRPLADFIIICLQNALPPFSYMRLKYSCNKLGVQGSMFGQTLEISEIVEQSIGTCPQVAILSK